MKPTLKWMLNRIELWAEAHDMITSFGHGKPANMEKGEKRVHWTKLYVVVNDPSILPSGVDFSLSLRVFSPTIENPQDNTEDMESMKQVLSDNLQIIQDFATEIANGSARADGGFFTDNGNEIVSLENTRVIARKYLEEQGQRVTGWDAIFNISVIDPFDACRIPYSSFPQPSDETCPSVTILDENGQEIETIEAGGTYQTSGAAGPITLPYSEPTQGGKTEETFQPDQTDITPASVAVHLCSGKGGASPTIITFHEEPARKYGLGESDTIEIEVADSQVLISVPVDDGAQGVMVPPEQIKTVPAATSRMIVIDSDGEVTTTEEKLGFGGVAEHLFRASDYLPLEIVKDYAPVPASGKQTESILTDDSTISPASVSAKAVNTQGQDIAGTETIARTFGLGEVGLLAVTAPVGQIELKGGPAVSGIEAITVESGETIVDRKLARATHRVFNSPDPTDFTDTTVSIGIDGSHTFESPFTETSGPVVNPYTKALKFEGVYSRARTDSVVIPPYNQASTIAFNFKVTSALPSNSNIFLLSCITPTSAGASGFYCQYITAQKSLVLGWLDAGSGTQMYKLYSNMELPVNAYRRFVIEITGDRTDLFNLHLDGVLLSGTYTDGASANPTMTNGRMTLNARYLTTTGVQLSASAPRPARYSQVMVIDRALTALELAEVTARPKSSYSFVPTRLWASQDDNIGDITATCEITSEPLTHNIGANDTAGGSTGLVAEMDTMILWTP